MTNEEIIKITSRYWNLLQSIAKSLETPDDEILAEIKEQGKDLEEVTNKENNISLQNLKEKYKKIFPDTTLKDFWQFIKNCVNKELDYLQQEEDTEKQ